MKNASVVIVLSLFLMMAAGFLSIPTFPNIGLDAQASRIQSTVEQLHAQGADVKSLQSEITTLIMGQKQRLAFMERRQTYLLWICGAFSLMIAISVFLYKRRVKAEQGAGANG